MCVEKCHLFPASSLVAGKGLCINLNFSLQKKKKISMQLKCNLGIWISKHCHSKQLIPMTINGDLESHVNLFLMKCMTVTDSQAWKQQKLYSGPDKYVDSWLTNTDNKTSEMGDLPAFFFFCLKVNFQYWLLRNFFFYFGGKKKKKKGL